MEDDQAQAFSEVHQIPPPLVSKSKSKQHSSSSSEGFLRLHLHNPDQQLKVSNSEPAQHAL